MKLKYLNRFIEKRILSRSKFHPQKLQHGGGPQHVRHIETSSIESGRIGLAGIGKPIMGMGRPGKVSIGLGINGKFMCGFGSITKE
ncbi:unnamed protein product [Adineta ricciae]|uniref:Uncharacterized protein n=1 Tax=Adineta ricciae TaxID=249248 RepID=A0A815VM70_ADIRI|nr:unnamed protein product [Adineta ricciae]